jgi:hypothetical protein
MVAASFEKNDDEEEKLEDIEDEYAPVPSEMMAALYELNEVVKNPAMIEDDVGCTINSAQDATTSISASRTFLAGIGTESLPDVETPADSYSQEMPSTSNLQPSFTSNEQVALSGRGDDPSMPNNDHGQVEVAIIPNPELMQGSQLDIYSNNQSLPLLEGTLVPDLSEEPVYDAFPIYPNHNNGRHVWSMRAPIFRAIIVGWLLLAVPAIVTSLYLVLKGRDDAVSEI